MLAGPESATAQKNSLEGIDLGPKMPTNVLENWIEECTRVAPDTAAAVQFVSEVGLDNGERAAPSLRYDLK